MTAGRPSRAILGLMAAALCAAAATGVWLAPESSWDPLLLATLLGLSIVSDLIAIETRIHRVLVSASFLAIVTAAALLGAAAAALIGVLTILAGWSRKRYQAGTGPEQP